MKNTFRFFKIIILSALTGIFFISCTEESLSVSISVSASSSTVSRGGTVNFTAVIEGMANIPQGVTWSIFGDDSENSGGTGYSGDPYILTPNTWVSGEGEYEYGYNYGKTSRNIYYSFDVVYGNIYYIWWDDSYTSSSTNIYVSYTNGGGSISVNSDTSSVFFTPHTNGTVLVRFDMNYNGDCTDGIFTAAYSTTGTKPSASNGNTVISSAGVLTVANNETRGTLTIQAASHFDRYLTAAVDITVIQPVITISPANVSVERGGTQSFSASIAGSDNPFQNIIWSLEQGAGTRDEPFPLTYNAWENGEITSTEFSSSVWYSINVASGSEHYIWWNDANDGDNSKTLDVLVSAFYSNGAQIFSNTDSGYSSSRYVYFSETILIKVSPKNSGSIGTFAVAFNNSGSMPTAVNSYNASTSIDANGVLTVAADETRTRFTVRAAAPLDKVSAAAVVTIPTAPIPFNTWVDGNITSNNAWFSFDVSKSATYCVWWNDSNDGDGIKTLDVSVSAYYSDGTLIFSDFDSGYTNYKSFYTDRSDTVLIKVSPAAPGGTGTFALAYNTSGSRSGIKNGIPLTRNLWTDGSIVTSTSSTVSYTIDVSYDNNYYIWWNDSNDGDGTKTLDVSVSAYYSDSTPIFYNIDAGYTNYRSFNSDINGTVIIKVSSKNIGSTGTFAIAYNTSGTRPEAIPLTLDTWEDGSINSSDGACLYSFNVVSGENYFVWWNDNSSGGVGDGDGTKTLDVRVSAYYSDGTEIFTSIDYGWWGNEIYAYRNDTVILIVTPYYNSYTGTFSIGYNTGNLGRPPLELKYNTWKYVSSYDDYSRFKFTATSTTQYIHIRSYSDDSYFVLYLYDNNNNHINTIYTSYYNNHNSISPLTSGQQYYMRVVIYCESDFYIGFNNTLTDEPQWE